MMPDYSGRWFVEKLVVGVWIVAYVADDEREAERFAAALRLKGETVAVKPAEPPALEASDVEQEEAIRDYNEGHI